MEKAKTLRLVLVLLFLTSSLSALGLPGMQVGLTPPYAPRPLCQSQFILVNYACASLPYNPAPPIIPPPEEPDNEPPSPDSDDSPDSPTSPAPVGQEHERPRHRRHRLHRQHMLRTESPAEAGCCKWLKAVDTECVCDLLVHLPTFLSRPVHHYAVTISEDCNVQFSCPSRIQV